ncbi:MAG: sn-glycerol-1-phosphate dehydrogenase [Desulfobacterales bacterium]
MQNQIDYAGLTLDRMTGMEIGDCPCGRRHEVPTREIALGAGALDRLPEMAGRWIGRGPILLVVDSNTLGAGGDRARTLLAGTGYDVVLHRSDAREATVHADGETVAELSETIRRTAPAGVLAVGAGTINDICKAAATDAKLPLITVATAASMNGYTSAITALTLNGLKVTAPCLPPVAVIADPEILATAPQAMNAAGFGDLLSKNASTADWVMSHFLLGDYFCEVPVRVVEKAVEACIRHAGGIRKNDENSLAVLSEALLRSGISMVLAGSSSPASGGEHLISHLWDMTAHWSGRSPALHGAQTGVTTLLSLALYERLLELDETAIRAIDARPAFASEEDLDAELGETFRDLAPSILPEARRKYMNAEDLNHRRELILAQWEAIREAVGKVVIPSRTSRRHLEAAGGAVTSKALGISPEILRFAFRNARWIRNRYTVLDLAAEIGVLDDWMEGVIAEANIE